MTANLPASRQVRSRAYDASLTVAVATLMAVQVMRDRALARPRDAGDVVEKVIMVAGLAVAAIAAVAYLRPVITRYLNKIQ